MSDEQSLLLLVGKMDGKLDAFIKTMEGCIKTVTDQEKRIRSLEATKAWLFGVCAGVSTIVSTAFLLLQWAWDHFISQGKHL